MNYSKEQIVMLLISLGFPSLKEMSSTRLAVLTSENRVSTLEKIKSGIKGAIYDEKPGSDSSCGRVKIGKFVILAKPSGKQGRASAGVENEDTLVNEINLRCKTGPINVLFKAKNKDFEVIGATGSKSVGADTAGRKKADIIIKTKARDIPISIKKSDAETWESADSYFGKEAKVIIDKAVEDGKTKLVSQGSYFTLEPNIAVEATKAEKEDTVFGSDLYPHGAVVTKTFTSTSFKFIGDVLVVECDHIVTELKDVKGDKDVFFLIRNDKTRKSIKEYPGIRVLAAYKKRINKNVVVVERP